MSSLRSPTRVAGRAPLEIQSRTVAGLTRSSSATSATVSQGSSVGSASSVSGSDRELQFHERNNRKQRNCVIASCQERSCEPASVITIVQSPDVSPGWSSEVSERLLKAEEVAELLAVPKTRVWSMSRRGEIPPFGSDRGRCAIGRPMSTPGSRGEPARGPEARAPDQRSVPRGAAGEGRQPVLGALSAAATYAAATVSAEWCGSGREPPRSCRSSA
jgi:hypothetical protein